MLPKNRLILSWKKGARKKREIINIWMCLVVCLIWQNIGNIELCIISLQLAVFTVNSVDELYRFNMLRTKTIILICNNIFHLLIMKNLSFKLQRCLFLYC